ncbi:MAG TPA: cyclic nucleotide-binding domain-containing protein [Caulobacteraceae bacterium]|nr:cyclic nucleotide-binding domain-containing protein [Caulobacteraceae bacterium]
MTEQAGTLDEGRREQIYPVLTPEALERLRRFGAARDFAAGEAVVGVGEAGHGLILVASGEIRVSRHDGLGHREDVATYRAGGFLGELASLTGRPALIDAVAETAVEAVIIAPERLRALLVAEAEIGETIMRALILRRVRLLATPGVGPIIVGRADDGDVLRLEGFLGRNGQPHQTLDPASDPEARTLIERFHIEAVEGAQVVAALHAYLGAADGR